MTLSITAVASRAPSLVVTAVALTWALGVIVFGLIDLSAQLLNRAIRIPLYWSNDSYRFTDTGDGLTGAALISGSGGSVLATVTDASLGALALHTIAVVVSMAPQVVLAATAFIVSRRASDGFTFTTVATRGLFIAAWTLLALAPISQVLDWLARLAVLGDSRSESFTRGFVFDPLSVTGGLVLLLFAFAFRTGERLQRETAGLV